MPACLVWGQAMSSLFRQASPVLRPQMGNGGGPIGFLSHCVSHSSCGPPQASWAVGDITALGARLRWKPLSVPTLLGKFPPLLGCRGWGGDAFTQGVKPVHPPTQKTSLSAPLVEEGRRGIGTGCRGGQHPQFWPCEMWRLLRCSFLEALPAFREFVQYSFGGLFFPRKSLNLPQLPDSLAGP